MWLETVSLISLRIFIFRLVLICSFSSNPLFYEMTFTSVEIDFGTKFQLFCDWQLNTVFILLLEDLLTWCSEGRWPTHCYRYLTFKKIRIVVNFTNSGNFCFWRELSELLNQMIAEANFRLPERLNVTDGNISENFKKWKREFEVYRVASGSSGKAKKKSGQLFCYIVLDSRSSRFMTSLHGTQMSLIKKTTQQEFLQS